MRAPGYARPPENPGSSETHGAPASGPTARPPPLSPGGLHALVHLPRPARSTRRRLVEDLREGGRRGLEGDHPHLEHADPAEDRRTRVVVDPAPADPRRQHRGLVYRERRPGEALQPGNRV